MLRAEGPASDRGGCQPQQDASGRPEHKADRQAGLAGDRGSPCGRVAGARGDRRRDPGQV